MTAKFYKNKRNELSKVLVNNSIAIIHSNYQTFKSADSLHEFKVNNNFYYLTGLKEDNIILVLANINNEYKEYLFIEKNDPILVKWVGAKYEKEEASKISGISNILYMDQFKGFVEGIVQPSRHSTELIDTIYSD